MAMIIKTFNEAEPRGIEPGYLLLSSGRVVDIHETVLGGIEFSELGALGRVEMMEAGSRELCEKKADEINAAGGAAIPVYSFCGNLSPTAYAAAVADRYGLIYAAPRDFSGEIIKQKSALKTLAREIQEFNVCERGAFYRAAIYSSAEDYLRHEPADTVTGLWFIGDESVADELKDYFDLTPDEFAEIQARFDSSL